MPDPIPEAQECLDLIKKIREEYYLVRGSVRAWHACQALDVAAAKIAAKFNLTLPQYKCPCPCHLTNGGCVRFDPPCCAKIGERQ